MSRTIEGVMTDYGVYILRGDELDAANKIPKTKNGNYDLRYKAAREQMVRTTEAMRMLTERRIDGLE